MSGAIPLSGGKVAGLIGAFRDQRVAVVGDVMLDEYLFGEVERTSPEAPVPLVKIESESHRLGGAANVAHLVATLGGHAGLWALIGQDAAGERFLAKCREAGVDATNVQQVTNRPTARKVRVLAQHQHVLRLDWEECNWIDDEMAARIVTAFRASEPSQAIIVSDYAKGLLTPTVIKGVIEVAREQGIPVLVDPKSTDFSRYRGATIITPNQREFEAAAGRKLGDDPLRDLADAGAKLLEVAEAEHLIVTLGERGLAIVPHDAAPVLLDTTPRDVFDVSGAGDTVIAVLALSLAAGARIDEAARLANEAAGITVGRSGVSVVAPGELAGCFSPRLDHKVLTHAELTDRVAWWRLRGRRIVFTNGCFDLLHMGHVSLLREAARHGDVVIVAINSDASVQRLKGDGRPLIAGAERAALLAALDCVDVVVEFDEDTPLELLQQVCPDVLAKGADYRPDQVVGRDVVEEAGGEVVLIPLVSGYSTSLLLERIQATSRPAREPPRADLDGATRAPRPSGPDA